MKLSEGYEVSASCRLSPVRASDTHLADVLSSRRSESGEQVKLAELALEYRDADLAKGIQNFVRDRAFRDQVCDGIRGRHDE